MLCFAPYRRAQAMDYIDTTGRYVGAFVAEQQAGNGICLPFGAFEALNAFDLAPSAAGSLARF